ncbi:hypothetical protein ABCR94_38465 [Streptomyces sp. 21So2-11]|uniref:hypothetical protein n=1 Tax=Streptomyces sp. 21So2-11 TaxID=3144408 RepID=UPI00321B6E3A
MNLGDSLTSQALAAGQRVTPTAAPPGTIRLAVVLTDGSIQHFERPATGDSKNWRATDFETAGGGCAFDEPVTAEWGHALDLFTHATTR